MFTKNPAVQTQVKPQSDFILHTVYKESTATLTFVKKIKNFTKIKLKKSLAGDNLRIPLSLGLEMPFGRKQKTYNNKNIKNCIVQSSTCEKEGEMMWINN